jgi:hypothetical protein
VSRCQATRTAPSMSASRLHGVQFTSLQGLACAATDWPDAPQHRACVPRSCTRVLEQCRALRVLKPIVCLSLLFTRPLYSCVCACKGGERIPCLFVFHPSLPRFQAGTPPPRKARRRGSAPRAREPSSGRHTPPRQQIQIRQGGPHVAVRPNRVQLRPSVLVGSWSRVHGGSVDFGPLGPLGRAHWASFGPVAHSAHYQPT